MIALIVVAMVSGCSDFNVKRLAVGSNRALATRADIRIVTERPNPYPATTASTSPNILCSEPSPDVALALSRAITAEASAKGPGAIDASGKAGYQMTQSAMALAGRTTAVVALRDGLFRACEAYSNGIIGADAYALILSQYGDLLVTLILGDAASMPPAAGGPTVAVAGPAAPPAANDKSVGAAERAQAIARDYFTGEQARLVKALFVVCSAEGERRRRENIGFPRAVTDPAADYFDKLCTMNLDIVRAVATAPAQ